MKKFLSVLCLSITVSHMALADTTIPWTKAGCESVKGQWITAHSSTDSGCDAAHCNGLSFCKSPQVMTWFSALTWCKSIGHKLVDFNHLCPGIPTGLNGTTGACANVQGISSGWGWTATPRDDRKSFAITLHNGSIDYNGERNHNNVYAICAE